MKFFTVCQCHLCQENFIYKPKQLSDVFPVRMDFPQAELPSLLDTLAGATWDVFGKNAPAAQGSRGSGDRGSGGRGSGTRRSGGKRRLKGQGSFALISTCGRKDVLRIAMPEGVKLEVYRNMQEMLNVVVKTLLYHSYLTLVTVFL